MKGKLNVEKLVAKYLLGDITALERKQLEDWTKSSPERKEFFNRLCTNIAFRERYEAYSHINSHLAWERFKKKYCPSIISTYLKYAAILTIPILIITGGWYFSTSPQVETLNNFTLGDAIQPGIPKATLILAENNKQSLTPTYPIPVKVNHSTTAIAQNGTLIYPTTPNINDTLHTKQNETIENNTLTTEQGNEFRVTFEDGTTVHLNYNTEIRYPVKFSKTKRIVYLKGEAYFKIAKDSRPFYVITDHGTIKQYGTEFNVNTFIPERTEIALVKGSISIISKESAQEQFIKPGQLAHIEQKGNNVSIYE